MKSILLVDDEAMVRIGVKTCVNWEKLNIGQIYEASNGQEALRIIQTYPVDIIITDIKMSVMDGFAMLEELKKQALYPKVIIMSCYNDYDTMHQAIIHGVKDFLFKPKMYPSDIEQAILNLESENSISALSDTAAKFSRITPDNFLEYFAEILDTVNITECSFKDVLRLVSDFTIHLMELDTPNQPSLHIFCSLLFQKLYELKKAKDKNECLEILNSLQQFPKNSMKEKLSEALAYIDHHLADINLNQEAVASHVGLSTSYFCRLFKSEMGKGYSRYIVEKRIEMADLLLSSTDMKTNEIAQAVGYTNEHYFARLYKEYTGHSMRQK